MRVLLSHPKANKARSADYQCDQYWHRDHDREACSVFVKSQQAFVVAGGLEGACCWNECVCHGANKLSYVAAKGVGDRVKRDRGCGNERADDQIIRLIDELDRNHR